MHVVVSGASGFLGVPLVAHLRERGHQVTRLIRSGTAADDASVWDPGTRTVDQALVDQADAVINLSGASIARWPRTKAYQRELLSSRVDTTATLATAVAASSTPTTLLNGSAMGIYGQDRGTELLTESSPAGTGFLAELTQAWERATGPAADAGQRVVLLRTALPLHADGGLLGPLLPAFKLGLGARLGSGRQHMSLISLHDWLRAVAFLLETPDAVGPFNLVAPTSVTNADFTEALGRAVRRPTLLVAPSPVLRAALGPLAGDMIGSLRLAPAALQDAGFTFAEPDLPSIVDAALR